MGDYRQRLLTDVNTTIENNAAAIESIVNPTGDIVPKNMQRDIIDAITAVDIIDAILRAKLWVSFNVAKSYSACCLFHFIFLSCNIIKALFFINLFLKMRI